VADESYDEVITELTTIYEAEGVTLFHAGDEVRNGQQLFCSITYILQHERRYGFDC